MKLFCTNCGHEITADKTFCDNCGTSVKDEAVAKSPGTSRLSDAKVNPCGEPRSGRNRRPFLIAGAATVAIAIAGAWWGGIRVPYLSEGDGGGRSGTTPTVAQPARPSEKAIVGQPSAPDATGTTAPEITKSPLFAGAGKIDSFEGEVRITSKSGERAAEAGLDLKEGDAIRTGANAWVLLEMNDGATITVRPGTQTRIETYHYAPDGAASENRSAISIVKGALRVITGMIGQTNRQGYSISTPTATIGIRGTDHEPSYYPPGDADLAGQSPGTYDKVNAGETVIRNPQGEVAVQPGRSAFVQHNPGVAPQLLTREPTFYLRHAKFDKPVATRRTEIHHRIERERQLRPKPPAAMPEKKARQEASKEHEKKRANEKDTKPPSKAGDAQPKTPQQLQQERPKDPEQKRASEKDTKPQSKASDAQPKTPQQLQQERLKEQKQKPADEKDSKLQLKAGEEPPKTPQQLRQERLKELEQKRTSEKDAKLQSKAGDAQPKTPRQLQQGRLKEQKQKPADEKDSKLQPKADEEPPKTSQQLRQERLKELEQKRASAKDARLPPKTVKEQEQKDASEKDVKPQPKTSSTPPKTPQQLQQERLKEMERRRAQQEREAAEAKAREK